MKIFSHVFDVLGSFEVITEYSIDVCAQHENSKRFVGDGAGYLMQYVREVAGMANKHVA